MNEVIINQILAEMLSILNNFQNEKLKLVLESKLSKFELKERTVSTGNTEEDFKLIDLFIEAKHVEGCSDKSLKYYKNVIWKMLNAIKKNIKEIQTDDLRQYLTNYQNERKVSKISIDNVRRILSSFYGWLEDENYILKSPVRRIHKVKTDICIKETYTDETLEVMRDNCKDIRDLAIIDLLSSTGMRIGEMVLLNRNDIDFNERECIVFGKGNKERLVYFDARTKIHLKNYIDSRVDSNDALFVSIRKPYKRITIGGVEARLRKFGRMLNIKKVHPHKFRRTLATVAIDKGMPIEQVQQLLGHKRIDTTLQYAMVKQSNIKMSHKRYIG